VAEKERSPETSSGNNLSILDSGAGGVPVKSSVSWVSTEGARVNSVVVVVVARLLLADVEGDADRLLGRSLEVSRRLDVAAVGRAE
jgi:hypothetical protein